MPTGVQSDRQRFWHKLASARAIVSLHDQQCDDQICFTPRSSAASDGPHHVSVLHTPVPATDPRLGSLPGSSPGCWEARDTERWTTVCCVTAARPFPLPCVLERCPAGTWRTLQRCFWWMTAGAETAARLGNTVHWFWPPAEQTSAQCSPALIHQLTS